MRSMVTATIRRGEESGYVAVCEELSAVTQGETLDETAANLREAVALALDGENLEELGLIEHPIVVVTFELAAAVA